MALSQANLTIGLGIDTAKFKVDLKTAQAEVRKFTADLNKAVKIGDPAAAAAAQKSLLGATRQVDLLTGALQRNTRAQAENVVATRRTSSAFDGMGRNIGVALGGVRAMRFGLAGLAATLASKAFFDGVDKLNELQSTMRAIGGATGSKDIGGLQAARKTIEATGQAASVADTSVAAFNKSLDESRLKGASGIVARGGRGDQAGRGVIGGPSVLRGAGEEKLALDDMGKALDINADKSRENWKVRGDMARRILSETDALKQNEATQKFLNGTFAQNIELLKQWAAQTKPDVGPSREALERARQTAAALSDLKTAFTDLQTIIVNEFGPSVTAALQAVTQSGFADTIHQQIQLTKSDFQQLKDAADAVVAKWNEVDAWIKSHSGLFEKLLQGSPGVTFQPGELTGGLAAGGYISGPGSGTSDSILARLSNGEFVMRAAAVQKWGRGFMHGLNSFADGGLVGMPTRFAAGGLAGGGGTPVHLHLGSQSFALSGAQPVVSALVSEAHAQRMRSAGTKPSWFGSRAGGR